MSVLPSNHLIKFTPMYIVYIDILKTAISAVQENTNLVTIEITSTYPEQARDI